MCVFSPALLFEFRAEDSSCVKHADVLMLLVFTFRVQRITREEIHPKAAALTTLHAVALLSNDES